MNFYKSIDGFFVGLDDASRTVSELTVGSGMLNINTTSYPDTPEGASAYGMFKNKLSTLTAASDSEIADLKAQVSTFQAVVNS